MSAATANTVDATVKPVVEETVKPTAVVESPVKPKNARTAILEAQQQMNEKPPQPKNIFEAYEGFFTVEAVKNFFIALKNGDMKSGLVVAFISLPLSTALSIASGGTPIMGLATAAFGPFIGGMLGGSQYNILGPAGALVNILNALTVKQGV